MSEQSSDPRIKEKDFLLALGLCARARNLVFGTEAVCEALRGGRETVYAVVEASNTSENTHKRILDKCHFYHVQRFQLTFSEADELGRALGKKGPIAAVGITDKRMAEMVEKKRNAEM